MSARTYGLIAGLAGTAFGLWYWRRRFGGVDYGSRGTIVDNAPASAAEGVI